MMKPLQNEKKSAKGERERRVLLGLVDLYIKSGQPIGSNTLMEKGFKDLSSATIRNYFAHLEDSGYLLQQHSSGGRIPTDAAFRLYADTNAHRSSDSVKNKEARRRLKSLRFDETSEVLSYLHKAADVLGDLTGCAVFMSSPRFDHDCIHDLKLVAIDDSRCLCVIVTDFGLIQTHTLHTEKKLSSFSLKRIETFFRHRLSQHVDIPEEITPEELALARSFYNEVMVRYMIGYSNFTHEDIHHAGLSNLLSFPEFHDASALVDGLALFENPTALRFLVKECLHSNGLRYWVGNDLATVLHPDVACTVMSIPYYINNSPVGVVGLLGPMRVPYKDLFPMLRTFSDTISTALTKSLYTFKISFRQPQKGSLYLKSEERNLLDNKSNILLEDHSH